MSGEIEAASQRLRDRVDAADLAGAVAKGIDEAEAEATLRRMFSGLDLDFDELQEVTRQRQMQGNLVMLMSGKAGMVAATFFTEGIVVGLLIAEARQREEAQHG